MKSVEIEVPKGYEIDEEKSTFNKIIFKETPKEVSERIKTVEDACKSLGESDPEVVTLRLLESVSGLSKKSVDNQRLVVVIKALNEGWYPDWSKNDGKYYPVFTMRGGQVLYYVDYWTSASNVPAPFLLKSDKLVRYATSQFPDLYASVYA